MNLKERINKLESICNQKIEDYEYLYEAFEAGISLGKIEVAKKALEIIKKQQEIIEIAKEEIKHFKEFQEWFCQKISDTECDLDNYEKPWQESKSLEGLFSSMRDGLMASYRDGTEEALNKINQIDQENDTD